MSTPTITKWTLRNSGLILKTTSRNPLIFIILINNKEEEVEEEEEIEKVWEEHEIIDAEEQEDWEDDPEEILFEDEEWDVFSDMMIEYTVRSKPNFYYFTIFDLRVIHRICMMVKW
ncbi:hypothetical protein TIFTF001_034465 [Ficus carica]|uniref:Uncharacterized protein n=1 Tax=Ficus carica TaxID=3494 RepID=A0AA88DZU3_FICCA|nr:hypothetical protein TIFTF001_034465 [Ficus carica]